MFLSLLVAPAWGTSVLSLTPEEVRQRSAAVVVATIRETRAWWEPSSGLVRTDLLLEDVEVVWSVGPLVGLDQLTFTGGEAEGRLTTVPGMPAFPTDVRLLLFVEGDGQSEACPIVGWTQGQFSVGADGLLLNPGGWYLAVDDTGHLTRTTQRATAAKLHDVRRALRSSR